jgi:L-lactate dehydrogenase complex protein LldE
MDVALFVTCLTDTFAPRVGIAVVRVLRHFGCTVHFPAAQTCCGQPAYNNGFHKEAAAMGKRMIDVFDGYERVVTPSGSCASMVVHHIPELLATDPTYAEPARLLAARTWGFGTFLSEVLDVDLSSVAVDPARPVTYHYSCHLRGIQSPKQASQQVSSVSDIDYRPLDQLEQCCGFGGAFGALYPNISNAMVGDKLDAIERSGADTVICNEAGCSMTLEGTARRRGLNVTFKHLAEVLAESLGLMDDQP